MSGDYPRHLYGGRPPSERDANSRAAGEAIGGAANRLRALVRRAILDSRDGLTDEEIEGITGLIGSTVRPRRRELEELGEVVDTGRNRRTRSGRLAHVWGIPGRHLITPAPAANRSPRRAAPPCGCFGQPSLFEEPDHE